MFHLIEEAFKRLILRVNFAGLRLLGGQLTTSFKIRGFAFYILCGLTVLVKKDYQYEKFAPQFLRFLLKDKGINF